MVRRDAFLAAGGYDDALRCCEDVELYLRVGREHGAVFVDRDVLHYRVGFPSIMKDIRDDAANVDMADAYRVMGERYQARFGAFEFRALQFVAKAAGWLAHISPLSFSSGARRRVPHARASMTWDGAWATARTKGGRRRLADAPSPRRGAKVRVR